MRPHLGLWAQAQAITNFLRVDPVSGETVVGQIQLVRLANSAGNTLITIGSQSDAAGNVYLLQNAACCLVSRLVPPPPTLSRSQPRPSALVCVTAQHG